MPNAYDQAMKKALQKAQRTKKDVIYTDPRITRKGNTTCAACKLAARRGTPLPPNHEHCRCQVIGKPTNY